jgi:hypothetical protein
MRPGQGPRRMRRREAFRWATGCMAWHFEQHVTIPALIPGATYRLAIPGTTGTQRHKDFTVKPGETIDLGDILIERPAP